MQNRTPDRIGENDGVIGVIGVAPWSTMSFIEILFKKVSAKKDWHYPRIICDFNTKIPSRGRHFELNEEDFSPYIKSNIRNLKEYGASVIAVTCNTAHIYFNKWASKSQIPVLHIMQTAVESLNFSGSKRVVFLCGWSLRKYGIYQEMFKAYGLEYLDLTDEQAADVAGTIEEIKCTGKISDSTLSRYHEFFEILRTKEVDSILLACTELSVLKQCAQKYFRVVVDSNEALAEAAIRAAIGDQKRIIEN